MVAAANPARSIIFRIGAPLILVTMFGGLLAWGYTGESASQPDAAARLSNAGVSSQPQIAPVSYRNERPMSGALNAAIDKSEVADELTSEQARRTALKFARGSLGTVQVVDTDAGQAIVALSNHRKAGKTNFFVLEKQNDKYRISTQALLDSQGFHNGTWSSELVDADEDGYPEVIFSGRDSDDNRTQQCLTLFVPNDNRMYSMLLTGETTLRGNPRIIWLSNAAGTNAAAYRTALRQKARAIVAKK
jgi:hypothetical protein